MCEKFKLEKPWAEVLPKLEVYGHLKILLYFRNCYIKCEGTIPEKSNLKLYGDLRIWVFLGMKFENLGVIWVKFEY